VSISDYQRRPVPHANWQRTVYHGIPRNLYKFHQGPGEYLAFLGRTSPEKRLDRAIEIARAARMPLKIAARIDPVDQEYYKKEIEPLMHEAREYVEFVGQIGDKEKDAFLGNARAMLFPIDWPEPFGLVMAESLACGTPVIAWRNGSAPEVIDDGETGFVVESIEDAVAAVGRLDEIDRAVCRRTFEARFCSTRMALDYVDVYKRLQPSWSEAPARTASAADMAAQLDIPACPSEVI